MLFNHSIQVCESRPQNDLEETLSTKTNIVEKVGSYSQILQNTTSQNYYLTLNIFINTNCTIKRLSTFSEGVVFTLINSLI